MEITPKILQMFIPGGVHSWVKSLKKFLEENAGEID